jgi:methyl-accepting chemotaxis protein WspA
LDKTHRPGIAAMLVGMMGALVALFLFFAGCVYWTINKVKVGSETYVRIIEGKDLVADVLPPPAYIIESYLLTLQMSESTDAREIERLQAKGVTLRTEYDTSHARWDETLPPGALRSAMVDRAHRAALAFFRARDERYIPALERGDREGALAVLRGEMRTAYDAHRLAIDDTVPRARAQSAEHEELATQAVTFSLTLLFVLGVCVLAIALGMGVYAMRIAHALVSRIRTATTAAERVAEGDLTIRVEGSGDDESSSLLVAVGKMAVGLETLVGRVKRASVELMSTATEFAATTASQEATIAGFGASSSEIAAAVKEISATSQALLATMEDVARLSADTADLADQGRTSISGLDQTMRGLAHATSGIATKLGTIREKAGDINVVVTTITKVADQTHLLSVNAAIEAEKAGEQGLGFLVLAREIRRLADQTAVATLNIEQLVRQMQTAVGAGVSEMDRFTIDVQRGVTTATDVGARFARIIEQVQGLSRRFVEVGEGMRSQSQGAKQIDEAMRQLTDGARHTAASLREFTTATDHMRQAVGGLRTEIAGFKVRE